MVSSVGSYKPVTEQFIVGSLSTPIVAHIYNMVLAVHLIVYI